MNILELIIDEEAELYGIDAISLVEAPAIESDFIAMKSQLLEFKTQDQEKRITVKVPASLHRAVKAKGALQDMTMSDVVRLFLEAWIAGKIELPAPESESEDTG